MSGRLAILGAGGHGRVVADCAERLGWSRISFFDDNPNAEKPGPWNLVGTGADLRASVADFDAFIVGIGINRIRLQRQQALVAAGGQVTTLIHPAATVSRHTVIGAGSVVFAGAVVNVGAVVGQACILNTGCGIDHDDYLADGVHVSPGAHLGGGVSVGEASWIGLGASVREGVSIGRDVRVGAGAVVVRHIADGLTVVGNPARDMKRSPDA
jgi:sugar O-acyltransferase (sialic acid O-acetyltransferase NeuD family)